MRLRRFVLSGFLLVMAFFACGEAVDVSAAECENGCKGLEKFNRLYEQCIAKCRKETPASKGSASTGTAVSGGSGGGGTVAVGDANTNAGELAFFDNLVTVAGDDTSQVSSRYSNFGKMINLLAHLLTLGAGMMFFFLILTSGYRLIFSANKQESLSQVRRRLTIGIVGLAVVMLAYAVTTILLNLTGIESTYNAT